jgi:hypothetical protein
MNRIVALFLFILIAVSLAAAQNSHPKGAATKSAPTTASVAPRAKWNSSWQEFGGVSQEDFQTFGFDSLSTDQGQLIFTWILKNQASLTCGRSYPPSEKEALKQIHPFIEAATTDSGTFVGELRSRIGSTQDVKLAYADSDSDLIVSVMAMPVRSGERVSGHMAAVTVLSPCTYIVPSGWSHGTSTFRKIIGHFVQIGPDEATVLARVASSLDVDDFDPVRNEHSTMIKMYQ